VRAAVGAQLIGDQDEPCVLTGESARRAGLTSATWHIYHSGMATLIDNEKRANQLARAIASDLTLYHEPKINEGLTNDTLFDTLKDEITEGRELFKSRVTPEIFGQNIFERAIVNVLIKSKGHVKSKIW
jgi:hypothetical protein